MHDNAVLKKMYILYTYIYVVCGASKYTLASKAKDIYYNICMQIRIKTIALTMMSCTIYR